LKVIQISSRTIQLQVLTLVQSFKILFSRFNKFSDFIAPAERFQNIKKAYDVLSDPKNRELYDIFLGTGLLVPFELWKKEHETHGAVHWKGMLIT
jgi:hypothetical protein